MERKEETILQFIRGKALRNPARPLETLKVAKNLSPRSSERRPSELGGHTMGRLARVYNFEQTGVLWLLNFCEHS
jgi:hypothetical protein